MQIYCILTINEKVDSRCGAQIFQLSFVVKNYILNDYSILFFDCRKYGL